MLGSRFWEIAIWNFGYYVIKPKNQKISFFIQMWHVIHQTRGFLGCWIQIWCQNSNKINIRHILFYNQLSYSKDENSNLEKPLFCIDILKNILPVHHIILFIDRAISSTEYLVILSHIQRVWGGSDLFKNGLFEFFA